MSLERNKRVEARYDDLMREGKHGHYETLFQVVNEEVSALQSENAALREENDESHERNRIMRDENAALRKALEPFIECAKCIPPEWEDDHGLGEWALGLDVGDLRRAALTKGEMD